MVRQKSRNRGLYKAKMVKATETSSGFSTWNGALSRESCQRQPGSNIDKKENGRELLVRQLQEELLTKTYRPSPVERVYIPKTNGKTRPLDISIIRDRVVQATVKMVLEPIYESVFYPFSWGFRPLRSTHHALSAIRRGPSQAKNGYKWIIEKER